MALRTLTGLLATLTAAIPLTAIDGSTGTLDIATNALSVNGVVVDPTSTLTYATVRAVATTAITDLAAGAPNSVDGVSLQAGDLVLVTAQADAAENGIYEVDTLGTGSNGAWSRPASRDEGTELPVGMLAFVKGGTAKKWTMWKLVTFDGTIDTDDMVWNEHDEGLKPSSASGGEPEAVGDGDGTTLNFDLDGPSPVFVQVSVDGFVQAPSVYSVSATGGTGGVAQLQFASGNAPASGAKVEAIVLYRS